MSNTNFYVAIPRHMLERIKELETRLYSEQRMTADEMRNWANWINQGLIPSVEELDI